MSKTWLMVLGDRVGIHWVLANATAAFPARREAAAFQLSVGDDLLLYSTRGAWHDPTRSVGQVFGTASVKHPPVRLDVPLDLIGRSFTTACSLRMGHVSRPRMGLPLAPLVPTLDAFPKKHAWSAYLRRPLVLLPPKDAATLHDGLSQGVKLHKVKSVLEEYASAAHIDPYN